MVCGLWLVVCGTFATFLVFGRWSVVSDLWSIFHLVGGKFLVWSVVGGFYDRCGRWSVVG